ncbi:MAG: hypothetical protein ABSC07_13520 [Terriglobales bacterium]|jgi:hypothetical protein
MKHSRHCVRLLAALASVVVATFSLVACQQSQTPTPAPATAESKAVGTEKVFVEFRGPWAFAPDPKDANSVLAIAPKVKGHLDLYVQASNQSMLTTGVYDLTLPGHTGLAAATANPDIAQATIDTASLQHAIDSKSARYVIRLPKPEEYMIAGRSKSRVGTPYPPLASSEKDYAIAVALRYNVASLNGFLLGGTPDNGSFNPLLLQVEQPNIRFAIEPAGADNPMDKCDTHSRESFHELTTLLNLKLFVDFPDYNDACHKSDLQNVHPAKAEVDSMRPVEQASVSLAGFDLAAAFSEFLTAPAGSMRRYEAMLLFHAPGSDCKAPDLILTVTP